MIISWIPPLWVGMLVTYSQISCCRTDGLENVEHCGGEPEQAANGFDIGFVTSKIVVVRLMNY